eukprot:SAG31_NODE_35156_length_325_cov_1.592920_1_plen_30_part_01
MMHLPTTQAPNGGAIAPSADGVSGRTRPAL